MSTPSLRNISVCNASLAQLLYDNPITGRVFLRSISICMAKYRMLTVVDSSGNAINGATALLTDSGGNSWTYTSDANGIVSSYHNGDNLTNPCTLTVSKTGKQSFGPYPFSMTNRIDWVIQLVDESSGGVSIYVDLEQL